MYTPKPETLTRIQNDFVYHAPLVGRGQTDRYGAVRQKLLEVATYLLTVTPPSREQSLALTNLEQAMFWANASIARNEKE